MRKELGLECKKIASSLSLVFAISSFGFLVACSSSEKEQDEVDAPKASSVVKPKTDLTQMSTPPPAKAPPPPPPPPVAVEKQAAPANPDQELTEAIRSGNQEGIYRTAVSMLAANPKEAKALNALGLYYYGRSQFGAAELMFAKAAEANPGLAEPHTNLGLVKLVNKERPEAIRHFRKALETDPSNVVAAANLGTMYVQEKDFGKALAALEIAIRRYSQDPKILNNYAIALAATGNKQAAKDNYEKALNIKNNDRDILFNYAILMVDGFKNSKEGMDLINRLKVVGLSPEARNKINALENRARAGLK